MTTRPTPETIIRESMQRIGYLPYGEASPAVYERLGFRCGLEIHQQLATAKKLFCRCPTGRYHGGEDYDAELVRHMRPTLSELGEYDGTALMEFKTRKDILYRIKSESACTYDIDDTPPFPLNREALGIAIEIALLMRTNIVGELHITRKQYLDGSIPTGFQRTAIVGIEGEIPLPGKRVRIIQLSLEEDSCREVSDVGHVRVYTTDRLGTPLIETVTYPDLTTPHEAAAAADVIRFITRSTGKVNTGIGTARQDVNVSIEGGTRVEIKGVQHIRWIPKLTHNEAFRQRALLEIREELRCRVGDPKAWACRAVAVRPEQIGAVSATPDGRPPEALAWRAVNLPHFGGLLAFFTQPDRVFADEISDRLKVIACLDTPNMTHPEAVDPPLSSDTWARIGALLDAAPEDAQLLLWGPEGDMQTALETIDERCRWAFEGVPNETRKARHDGTTVFERVLPGPDRMYPDTDSAPIPVHEEMIEGPRKTLPTAIEDRIAWMEREGIPADAQRTLLRFNLIPLTERLVAESGERPAFIATLVAHTLRRHVGRLRPLDGSLAARLAALVRFVSERKLAPDILKAIAPGALADPTQDFATLLDRLGYRPVPSEELISRIPELVAAFETRGRTPRAGATRDWVMGRLRSEAIGNVRLAELAAAVAEACR